MSREDKVQEAFTLRVHPGAEQTWVASGYLWCISSLIMAFLSSLLTSRTFRPELCSLLYGAGVSRAIFLLNPLIFKDVSFTSMSFLFLIWTSVRSKLLPAKSSCQQLNYYSLCYNSDVNINRFCLLDYKYSFSVKDWL